MMNKVIILIANILLLANIMLLASCSDDDTFSTSPSFKLTFSADTLSLDTVFSTVPSHHKQLVVYNNNADGMRISKPGKRNEDTVPGERKRLISFRFAQ